MRAKVVLPVITTILILGSLGMIQQAYAGGLDLEDIIFTKEVDKSVINSGEQVKYTYTLENLDPVNSDSCTITDDKLGIIVDNVFVDALSVRGIVRSTFLDETTTNIATLECSRFMDTRSVMVTVVEPRVGGELLSIDTTSVLLAGTQTTAAWMIPVVVSAIGIGIVIARKF